MAISSIKRTPSAFDGLRCAIFGLEMDLHVYKTYLDTERFGAKPSNGDAKKVYDTHNGLDIGTSLGAWMRG